MRALAPLEGLDRFSGCEWLKPDAMAGFFRAWKATEEELMELLPRVVPGRVVAFIAAVKILNPELGREFQFAEDMAQDERARGPFFATANQVAPRVRTVRRRNRVG